MTATITTINPYTLTPIQRYDYMTPDRLDVLLRRAQTAFLSWRTVALSRKTKLLGQLADTLSLHKEKYSALITEEMGKPITESRLEIDKCINLCLYYQTNAAAFLAPISVDSSARESYISYDPLGCILGIMPWNFPFWQVFRFAIPTLTAGNTVVLKHATNVTGCALAIETLFKDSDYPQGCFTTLLAQHKDTEHLIANPLVKALSLTGSETAGKRIAAIAGAHLKPLVLELGGNNACIVLSDANLDLHLDTIVTARMLNAGQSCIAAKRFIVEADIYDVFLEQFTAKVAALKIGAPAANTTRLSVLARPDLVDTLAQQVNQSVTMGAKIHYGNQNNGCYYQPTILTHVTSKMPVFREETFGPVAAIVKAANAAEAFRLAQDSKFGLGTMVFTEDIAAAKNRSSTIEDAAFFINAMVKSDPRLPFGGTKHSGFGRELSKEGILAFTNTKTIYIS
jgi:succinate-semialdehyde dehydrogenase/glutarate-semialdehyde dehydrogenase